MNIHNSCRFFFFNHHSFYRFAFKFQTCEGTLRAVSAVHAGTGLDVLQIPFSYTMIKWEKPLNPRVMSAT